MLNAAKVNNSWTLLNESERMSNVPEGFKPRVMKRSRPYAKRSDVDSTSPGEDARDVAPRTYDAVLASSYCRQRMPQRKCERSTPHFYAILSAWAQAAGMVRTE